MPRTVYVVHCIDTEGPLYEDKEVVFDQIEAIYGIKLERNIETVEKILKYEMNLEGYENEIHTLVFQHMKKTKGNWDEIDKQIQMITTKEYRNLLKDTSGNGWIYSWFCMDHVGFTGKNPRRRAEGHHVVFDYYRNLVKVQNLGDIVQFHHHPVSISGNYNDSGTAYWGSDVLNQILCRKIIDRQWFPSVYRPGFHTERPDSHWFLEQWIPFDYGNQSVKNKQNAQKDLDNGRFGNWRYAPTEWFPYHPSHDDYQKKGSCRRWITRCLNMSARIREITIDDIRDAFIAAADGQDVILSFTNHDYKDMDAEITRVRNILSEVVKEFSEVRFEYVDALNAMRKVTNEKIEKIGMNLEVREKEYPPRIVVTAEGDIFGPQPYLAIKDKQGNYYWDNFDFVQEKIWAYTFDNNTIDYESVSQIGVATNNKSGVVEIVIYDFDNSSIEKTCVNFEEN